MKNKYFTRPLTNLMFKFMSLNAYFSLVSCGFTNPEHKTDRYFSVCKFRVFFRQNNKPLTLVWPVKRFFCEAHNKRNP